MPRYRLLSPAFIGGVMRYRDEEVEIDSPPEITPHELVKASVAKPVEAVKPTFVPKPEIRTEPPKVPPPKSKPVPTIDSTHQHLDVKIIPETGKSVPILPIHLGKPAKD